jgi:transposase
MKPTVQMEVCTIGLDLAKRVFQVHGADPGRRVIVKKQLRRGLVDFFKKKYPPLSLIWINA